MKKALGLVELLIVTVIAAILYVTVFSGSRYGRKNPFDDGTKIKNQQEIVDDKINEIEQSKALKQKIESNLQEGY